MSRQKNQSTDRTENAATVGDRAPGDSSRPAAEPVDLQLDSEPFEITPELVAANLFASAHDTIELPDEMKSTVERIWRDADFTWPTTISVTQVTFRVDDAPGAKSSQSASSQSASSQSASSQSVPSQSVYSRVSVLGTGWDAERPVSLAWGNAFGFPGDSITLPEAQPTANGFFGIDLILKTTPRKNAEFVWDAKDQLMLVARQTAENGQVIRETEQRGLPPHILWQWVR